MIRRSMNKFLLLFLIFCNALISSPFALAQSSTSQQAILKIDNQEWRITWGNEVIRPQENIHNIVIIKGQLRFFGRADRMVIAGGNVILEDGSHVNESLVILGGNLKKRNGAFVTENIRFGSPDDLPDWVDSSAARHIITASNLDFGFFFISLLTLFLYILGLLLIRFFPSFVNHVENKLLAFPLRSYCYSIYSVLLFVPILLILVISILGIFFIPLLFLIYSLIYLFSILALANFTGKRLPPKKFPNPYLRFSYGFVAVLLVSSIPYIGPLAIIIIAFGIMGATMGVLLKSKFGQHQLSNTPPKQLS